MKSLFRGSTSTALRLVSQFNVVTSQYDALSKHCFGGVWSSVKSAYHPAGKLSQIIRFYVVVVICGLQWPDKHTFLLKHAFF